MITEGSPLSSSLSSTRRFPFPHPFPSPRSLSVYCNSHLSLREIKDHSSVQTGSLFKGTTHWRVFFFILFPFLIPLLLLLFPILSMVSSISTLFPFIFQSFLSSEIEFFVMLQSMLFFHEKNMHRESAAIFVSSGVHYHRYRSDVTSHFSPSPSLQALNVPTIRTSPRLSKRWR